MLHPEIREALHQLEEATHSEGALFLVREAHHPWAVRWARGAPGILAGAASAEEPTGWWTVVDHEDRPRLRSELAAVDPDRVVEYRVDGRDGDPRWVRESLRRVELGDGGAALVSVLRDVTRERNADRRRPREGGPRVIPEGDASAGPLVLVVEDDDAVRSVLVRVLARQGFATVHAATAAEALRVFERSPRAPDVLVADAVLPDRPGPVLARALLRRTPSLPVLFISGYSRDELERRAEFPPGVPLLTKPFTAAELVEAIRASLTVERGGGGVVSGPESAAS